MLLREEKERIRSVRIQSHHQAFLKLVCLQAEFLFWPSWRDEFLPPLPSPFFLHYTTPLTFGKMLGASENRKRRRPPSILWVPAVRRQWDKYKHYIWFVLCLILGFVCFVTASGCTCLMGNCAVRMITVFSTCVFAFEPCNNPRSRVKSWNQAAVPEEQVRSRKVKQVVQRYSAESLWSPDWEAKVVQILLYWGSLQNGWEYYQQALRALIYAKQTVTIFKRRVTNS